MLLIWLLCPLCCLTSICLDRFKFSVCIWRQRVWWEKFTCKNSDKSIRFCREHLSVISLSLSLSFSLCPPPFQLVSVKTILYSNWTQDSGSVIYLCKTFLLNVHCSKNYSMSCCHWSHHPATVAFSDETIWLSRWSPQLWSDNTKGEHWFDFSFHCLTGANLVCKKNMPTYRFLQKHLH